MFKASLKAFKAPAPALIFEQQSSGQESVCQFSLEQTILEVAVENGVELSHSCGGMGTCGTCRVFLLEFSGEPVERNEIEAEMSEDRQFAANERLACQVLAKYASKIRVP